MSNYFGMILKCSVIPILKNKRLLYLYHENRYYYSFLSKTHLEEFIPIYRDIFV